MSKELKEFDDVEIEQTVERKYFEDIIVLGNAVPDEISDNRKTVCTVAFSKEYGMIRIYPVPPNAPMKRWNIISIPLERNSRDNRKESWKIQGSKAEWNTLSNKIKVKRKLSRKEWIDLINHLKENYSYDCIEDMNDQKLSLGIIIPKIIDKKFEERKNVDSTVQSTLVNDDLFMTIQNYGVRPVILYSCPKCRTKKQHHKQGVLEWGMYEWLRCNYNDKEQLWKNLHIDESGYDQTFLVGNMNLHRSRFMIISIFRYKL
ncbi:MAG: hypothetical protein K8823_21 [Cenarchaeum symbiont of Oopsacas minuta]|nr:hypothetical protein [Cenarchaeum symbiont of Oopsacas minuta]